MEVRDELQRLEGLILRDIPNLIDTNSKVTLEFLRIFKIEVREEIEGIKNNFTMSIVLFDKTPTTRQYIRYHQQNIIRLSSFLVQYAKPQKLENAKTKVMDHTVLCRYLYFTLEELLTFINRRYSKFIDADTWMPRNYRLIVFHSMQKNLKNLQTSLTEFKVNVQIVDFALAPIKEFFAVISSDEVTYRRVIYLKELQKELQYLIAQGENSDPSLAVQWRLLYLNYNSIKYFQFCTDQISQYYKETENVTEQIDRLALVQKLLNQFEVKPDFSYEPSMKSLKAQLTDWIAQEMEYIETRRHRLTVSVPGDPESSFKIKTELSVSQLAYLLKVFIEINLIQCKSVTSLLRIIQNIFQTKRTEHVGFSSLSGKYYKPETSTKKFVRDLLLRMVKHIEKSEPLTW